SPRARGATAGAERQRGPPGVGLPGPARRWAAGARPALGCRRPPGVGLPAPARRSPRLAPSEGVAVYVRVSTVVDTADIDAGAAHVRDVAVPRLREQAGFAGLTMSAARAASTVAVLTRWATEQDLRASEHAARTVREEALAVIGGTASVEAFEEVVYEVGDDAPSVGCVVRAREVR